MLKIRNTLLTLTMLCVMVATAHALTYKNWKVHSWTPGPLATITIEAADGTLETIAITQHQLDRVLDNGGVGTFVTVYDENDDLDTKDPNESVIVGPL